MNILEKISRSRDTILDIFDTEWNTDISSLSSKEVEQLYNLDMAFNGCKKNDVRLQTFFGFPIPLSSLPWYVHYLEKHRYVVWH